MADSVTVAQEEPKKSLPRHLLDDSDFTDVTLGSKDGLQVSAHRAVLCASSPFLRKLLVESLQQNTFLYLNLVNHEMLKALVEFVYLGSCQVPRSRMEDLKALARQLGVRTLEEASERFEDDQFEENCFDSDNSASKETGEQLNAFGQTIEEMKYRPPVNETLENDNPDNFKRAKLYERLPKIRIPSPNSEGVYTCEKCGKKICKWSRLKAHILVVHEGYLFKCSKCSEEFGSILKVRSHHIKRHNLKPYQCDICKNTFLHQRDLEKHKSQKPSKCEQCDFIGCNKKILTVHANIHDPMFGNGRFNCPQCHYNSRKKSIIVQHVKIVHDKIENFFCDQCTFKSTHKYRVDAHVRVFHQGIRLKCNLCEYTAASKKMLKTHTSQKHDGVRYSCNLCENKYNSVKNLQEHIKANHIKQKFTCPQCDVIMSYRSSFTRHLRQHSDKKKKQKEEAEKCSAIDCCRLGGLC